MRTLIYFCLVLMPIFTIAQSYLDQFPLELKTKYFDFRFKQNPERIKEIARFADNYVDVINRDFFKADYEYPIRVLVLEDQATFQRFLRKQFGVDDPPGFGIFLYKYNLFATYEDSGLGTFTHEIMHPLIERNLRDRPIWAIEGIPTFFEKFYGYWTNGALVVNWGYQNPWRINMLRGNLVQLNLKDILSTTETQGKYKESDRRMVSVFLWQQGKFKTFLNLIKNRQKNGYDSYFEAAMEMPIEKVLPLWQAYLNHTEVHRDEILRLPPSIILPDEATFQKFIHADSIRVNP